jgi:hypothetical protein
MSVEDPPQASQHYTTTERPAPRRSLVGPAILIGAGVVLFLNTAGWLGWDVEESILRMWPVLLIPAGISVLVATGHGGSQP